MPYTASTLAQVAQGNGNAIFHYRNTDSLTTMCAAGYFNASAAQFQVGDEIIVTRTGTNLGAVSLRVLAASESAVTVTAPLVSDRPRGKLVRIASARVVAGSAPPACG